MRKQPKRFYVFGVFRIDVNDRVLLGEKGAMPLTPKAFDTLLFLVENSGRVLGREEIMTGVWPDSFVEENNLAQNISALRKALGPEGNKFIETIPKRGYRFVADVSEKWEAGPDLIVRERTRARVIVEADDGVPDLPGPSTLLESQHPFFIGPDHATREFHYLPAEVPETMYARSGDVNIAYQVVGEAPLDLVFVMGWVSHLEYFWKEPNFARFLMRLASFSRLILFDKRGTGLSDRVPNNELPTLEQRMDDVRAVMDAAGSERAALCGVSEGGPMCSLFAATYPEKTIALVMIGTYAKRIRDEQYPWGPTTEQRQHFFDQIRAEWGGPVGLEERAPSVATDPQFREWWATYLRMGASPGAALALTQMNAEIDVRPVLPTIRVPTMVIHRTGDQCLKVEEGRYVANQIPGARFVELPGDDHLPFVGDQNSMLDEVEEFLTGVRHSREPDTVLATILYTRILNPEEHARRFGEERWRELLRRLRSHIGKEIEWFRGREVDMVGDRPLAIFDGPARAIRAASAINEYASRLQIPMRSGLHTGECEMSDGKVTGLATEICLQISNQAGPHEVLVSNTVKDLVAGSGIRFTEKATHTLAGIPGEWQLFAVERLAK
jgi:pimeloyl-ACP methyl ester carboxylesterase/DNA-binding winged helix-turn-helix (wHTH) protein